MIFLEVQVGCCFGECLGAGTVDSLSAATWQSVGLVLWQSCLEFGDLGRDVWLGQLVGDLGRLGCFLLVKYSLDHHEWVLCFGFGQVTS